MRIAKERITLKKQATKYDYYILKYKIQNYITTGSEYTISALYNNDIVKLNNNQLKKGKLVNIPNADKGNLFFENEKQRIRYVFDYLIGKSIAPNNKIINYYLYENYNDVLNYLEFNTEGDENLLFDENLYLDDITNEGKDGLSYITNHIPNNKEEKEIQKQNEEDYRISELEKIDLEYIFKKHLYETGDGNSNHNRVLHLLSYYKEKNKIPILHYSEFSRSFIDKLIRFAIANGYKIDNSKVARYKISVIKKLASSLRKYGDWLDQNEFEINLNYARFKLISGNKKDAHIRYVVKDEINVWAISGEELEIIRKFDFNKVKDSERRNRLEKTRDLFLIDVYLGGLRIGNLTGLTKKSFHVAPNGRHKVTYKSSKTGVMITNTIPNFALPLIQKYDFDFTNFFKYSQNYNEQLKEMAKEMELNRLITQYETYAHLEEPQRYEMPMHSIFSSKAGRKALISLLYNTLDAKGEHKYSLEQIAKITDHSMSSIKHYLAIEVDQTAKMLDDLEL
ncbi:hypothetical protein SAMN05661096_01033 [Marivirga sericea]|uniref:Phage integrase SAM-like domain-containing protein n=1 Tax=Marivirga sericea TaxID=1028 RepID=A0A1X7IT11_9BACT|nr:hypothetical protein [Marivirga sericea]SMG18188.1 hypothetical protein SAMN05661096_01033 [Marivirga sericea]